MMKKIGVYRGKTTYKCREWVEGNLVFDDEHRPFIVRLANESDEPCDIITIMDIEYVADYVEFETIEEAE
jgi:hypothetical protein